jgi:predicted acetyltransferase
MGQHIELQPIPETDKLVLRNLLHLYLYDLSEYKKTDVNNHGVFEYPRVDQYWSDDTCFPFYIHVDGHIAGFVLIHRYDLLRQNRHVISEFFVLRKYRRRGVGTEAARLILSAFPGPWEVSEIPGNLPSQMFWRRVIGELTRGAYHETEIDGRPVQYFDYPPSS